MKYPKETIVIHKEIIHYTSSYICPYCKSEVNGAGLNLPTTRFKCLQCNKEVRVSKHEIIKHGT